MKIVDMARKDDGQDAMVSEPSPYPCGLRISLNKEDLGKLGIDELPDLGTQVAFYVCGEVVSTSESSEYGDSQCLGVQIQCMAQEELPADEEEEAQDAIKGGFKEAASKLYSKQK
ncbi:hypothetical protein LT85_1029 [Collimonas arenae]|uniref:Uncharacterized protein n=1 Tax=Collimonas arenae TaxID=279058 RepID=A0A0A1FBH7_9BURK|nr:hypothetical protein [Collimonas arenae]AIY40187.1 hypothetical protein LT85_1029 [Collimonas arenae]